MYVNVEQYESIKKQCAAFNATLIAVSKTKPAGAIMELYDLGHRDFGENYVQELVEKYEQLPKDIRWHFIGHLQTNKAKLIVPIAHTIHSVDSEKLLQTINKETAKVNKQVSCLLQMYIAQEETKYGLDEAEILVVMQKQGSYSNVKIVGLMAMASFTDNKHQIAQEFKVVNNLFQSLNSEHFNQLSIGMSSDYEIALQNGSTFVRVGSSIFGARNYNK